MRTLHTLQIVTKLFKILATALCCSLTLTGEYGMPVCLDIIFRLSGPNLLDTLLAVLAVAALLTVIFDFFRTVRWSLWIISWLFLIGYLIPYCLQSQEHVSPFSASQLFFWQFIALLVVLFAITVFQRLRGNGPRPILPK